MASDALVAVCQLAPVLGDVQGNVSRAGAAVTQAAAQGADVVVLPELVTTGYCFASPDELRPAAESASGPSVRAFADLAARHDLVVIGGFAEIDESDLLRNSAFVVDGSGLRAVYRKVHLWDAESTLFVPGDQPPAVVDTAMGRVGVCICYDLEFPEWTRVAALRGIDLLAVPTNWPDSPRPAGERPAEVVRAQAAASVDRIFVAVCDRVGTERGVEWVGGSAIIGPDGYPLALAERDGLTETLLAPCRLEDARDKATSTRNDVVKDRRPHLYGDVARPGA